MVEAQQQQAINSATALNSADSTVSGGASGGNSLNNSTHGSGVNSVSASGVDGDVHSDSVSVSGGDSGSGAANSSVRAVSSDYNSHSPYKLNASMQSVLSTNPNTNPSTNTNTNTIPIPPLTPADCVHKVTCKEAHFYRFVSTCYQSDVLFEVCVEDPNNGHKKR